MYTILAFVIFVVCVGFYNHVKWQEYEQETLEHEKEMYLLTKRLEKLEAMK